jgi:hypothetical protein
LFPKNEKLNRRNLDACAGVIQLFRSTEARGIQAMHVLPVFLMSLPLPVLYLAFIFAYAAG